MVDKFMDRVLEVARELSKFNRHQLDDNTVD